MICRFLLSVLLAAVATNAFADPFANSWSAVDEKNPVAALLQNDFGCTLIAPPSAQFDAVNNAGSGQLGNLTVPETIGDGFSVDLVSNGKLCPVSTQKPGEITDKTKLGGASRSLHWKKEISASVKLTAGKWLKLVDFDARDMTDVGIYISSIAGEYGEPQLIGAVRDMKRAYGNGGCSAFTDPKAQQVVRTCYGKITISLLADKHLNLNAFDLTFANLTVGLKASWVRSVQGDDTACDVGVGPAAAPTPADGAEAPKPVGEGTPKPATPAPASASAPTTPAKNGVLATIDLGSRGKIEITPAALDIFFPKDPKQQTVVSEPKPAQVAQVNSQPKPAAAKPAQPAAQEKLCAKNVVYQTTGIPILGVKLLTPTRTREVVKAAKP